MVVSARVLRVLGHAYGTATTVALIYFFIAGAVEALINFHVLRSPQRWAAFHQGWVPFGFMAALAAFWGNSRLARRALRREQLP
jgi:peptidoglycan/LPS O-acetylase OafA/YrhL